MEPKAHSAIKQEIPLPSRVIFSAFTLRQKLLLFDHLGWSWTLKLNKWIWISIHNHLRNTFRSEQLEVLLIEQSNLGVFFWFWREDTNSKADCTRITTT